VGLPALLVTLWVRSGSASAEEALREGLGRGGGAEAARRPCRIAGLVVLTNAPLRDDGASGAGARSHGAPWDVDPVWLGQEQLGALLDATPAVRRRVPGVLGVRELGPLLDDPLRRRSSWDEAAARELARVFVPTGAYRHALETLGRHRFAVLTGPPEMGKTAIARTLGLALATEGWQVHECIRPDQVWAAFDPERPQLFVADDAFGSTEYRPDAADRWALELDRILQRLDDRHWLVWTSRPAPLKAGLGRIHREHGVERFPRPAEVHVDASALGLEEKTLILFRHARAAELPPAAIDIVRGHGEAIVEHEHFTPGRIGRFVATRLPRLAAAARSDLAAAIEAEIAEPTVAMADSLRALPPEHRALLVAMVDQPPGPVGERELAATARRHAPAGLPRRPAELVERLADHFVRVLPPATVTWVHPSWRDLVIDDLAFDPAARRAFLERCSLDGLLLALSQGGGATGRRSLPLLVADADWDAAAERIHELVPELDTAGSTRLLASLEAAVFAADGPAADELLALATTTLERMSACWRRGVALPDAQLLERWLELAGRMPEPPSTLDLGQVWQRAAPPEGPVETAHAAERLAGWLRIGDALERREPGVLGRLDFPRAYASQLYALLDASADDRLVGSSGTLRRALLESLELVERLAPGHFGVRVQTYIRELRRMEPRVPDLPAPAPWPERARVRPAIVRRILADLG
jgi:hypothetical protein